MLHSLWQDCVRTVQKMHNSSADVQPESMDAFSFQEVVLPGQILAAVLKDALFAALAKLRTQYMVVSHGQLNLVATCVKVAFRVQLHNRGFRTSRVCRGCLIGASASESGRAEPRVGY